MDSLEEAKQTALRYVEVRLRTEREVAEQLRKKKYAAEVIDAVLQFLREYQYLDDRAYCRSWIYDRMQFHPCGRRKMAADLAKKISDRDLILQSLEEYFPPEEEYALALEAAQKKLAEGPVSMEKLGRFLSSRGYGTAIIGQVFRSEQVAELLRQEEAPRDFD